MAGLNKLRTGLALLALGCMLAVAGCGSLPGDAPMNEFAMNFNGFTPVIGKTFALKLTDASTGDTLALTTPTAIAADTFSVVIPNVVKDYHSYRVDYWVDADGNGTLDHSPNGAPGGSDASWSVVISGRGDGIHKTFTYATNFMDITPF